MPANRTIIPLIGRLLGVAMATVSLHATSNLIENSPFLPASGAGAGAAQQEAAPLELRSILKEGGDFEFSLYDPAKKLSTWARLNESGHDFVVKAFDPEKETVTIEQKSRTYKLVLKEAKITLAVGNPAQSPAIAGMQPGVAPGMPQPGFPSQPVPFSGVGRGPPGAAPSLTPDQLRNLEADINRRRELRRQAVAPQAGKPPVPPPQPQ